MMEKDFKRLYEDTEWELERVRDEQRRERNAEIARMHEEQQARREQWAEAQCYADSWEEAFSKGISRMRIEAHDEQVSGYDDPFFTKEVEQCEFAQQVYDEAMKEVRAKIKELEAQALVRAAEKVEAKFGETHISTALRDNDWRLLVEW